MSRNTRSRPKHSGIIVCRIAESQTRGFPDIVAQFPPRTLDALFLGNLRTSFTSFGETDRDCLLPALHDTALARTKRTSLLAVHYTLDALACGLSVFRHLVPPSQV